jgi:hypothetical protein
VRALKLSVALQVLLVFASGALVGGLGFRFYTHQSAPPPPAEMRKRNEGFRQFRQRYTEEMHKRLNLRADQVQQLSEIMDSSEHRFGELRKRIDGEVRKQMSGDVKVIQQEQQDKIRAMLDASQCTEYEKMLVERAKRMEERARKQGSREHSR